MLSIFRGKNPTKYLKGLCLGLLACCFAAPSHAMDWHGYGSVRMGQFSMQGQDAEIPEFYRGTSELSFSEETLFGVQMQHDISDDMQLVAQWQARGNRDFKPETKLLFLRWQLNDAWQLKAGRLDIPLFAQSDTQYIGFSHNYSRLPKSVYWRFDFETGEGISLEHQQNWSWATLKTQAQWSNFDGLLFKSAAGGSGIPSHLRDIRALKFNLDTQKVNLVAGLMKTDVDLQSLDQRFIASLTPTLQQLGGSPSQIADFFADTSFTNGGNYWFYGLRYHPGDWHFEVERTRYGIDGAIDGQTSAWFAAASRRFDDLVLTLHHEQISKHPLAASEVLREGTPPQFYPLLPLMVKSLNQRMLRLNVLSARYDLAPSMALKADYMLGDVVFVTDGSSQAAHGFSLGVDFVF